MIKYLNKSTNEIIEESDLKQIWVCDICGEDTNFVLNKTILKNHITHHTHICMSNNCCNALTKEIILNAEQCIKNNLLIDSDMYGKYLNITQLKNNDSINIYDVISILK